MEERPYSRGGHLPEPLSEDTSTHPHTFDNDASALAPEVAPLKTTLGTDAASKAPEKAFFHDGLETIGTAGDGVDVEKEAVANDPVPYACGFSKRVFWVSAGILGLIIIAIALGLGIGIGLPAARNSNPPVASNSATPLPGASPNSSSITNGVLKGSSFAAVESPDGSRQVFYQDLSGTLRQALYLTSTKSWQSSYVVPADARSGTPLAAVQGETPYGSPGIYLFYIARNDTVALSMSTSGVWEQVYTGISRNSSYSVGSTSKTLAVTRFQTASTSHQSFAVFFEAKRGGIAALIGKCFTNETSWTWKDLTPLFRPAIASATAGFSNELPIPPDLSLPSVPALSMLSEKGTEVEFLTTSSATGRAYQLPFTITEDKIDWGNPSGISSITIDNWADDSQLTLCRYFQNAKKEFIQPYPLWVQAGNLTIYPAGQFPARNISPLTTTVPTSPFPYSRLACTSSNETSEYRIYHQINESVIAEDSWSPNAGGWRSANIQIEISPAAAKP